MFGSFILLLPCLLVVLPTSHGKPVQVDNVKRLIRLAILKIQHENEEMKHTISPQVSLDPLPDMVPGNKPIQGLWSIVDDLTGFQLILDSMWGQNSDFKTNLSNYFSTLREYLKQKRVSLKCPARTPNSFKDLQDYLKENKKFNLSLVPRLLQRFNHYLNRCLSANVEAC